MNDTPRTNAMLTAILETHGHVGFLNCPPTWVAFARELERELNAANDRIRQLIAERDRARMQADQNWNLRRELESLLETDKIEEGVAAVQAMKDRIKRLEEELMEVKNKHSVLVADVALYEDRGERIKRLEEDSERLHWLLNRGLAWRDCYDDHWINGEWLYASQDAIETIDKAKEAKP